MAHQFEASQWVPYPVELVFAFFASPTNLPHLMPAWQRTQLERSRIQPPPPRPLVDDPKLRFQSTAAGVGSEMLISFRPLPGVPLRLRWSARITDFAWFRHFEDVQERGPFALWKHRHTVTRENQERQVGTRIDDQVEYRLPMGPLGTVANQLVVGRQMRAIFAYRQQRLLEILPVVARQAVQEAGLKDA